MTNALEDKSKDDLIRELRAQISMLKQDLNFWRAEYEAAAPEDYQETCESNGIDPEVSPFV